MFVVPAKERLEDSDTLNVARMAESFILKLTGGNEVIGQLKWAPKARLEKVSSSLLRELSVWA
jgi:hypothetical protein